MVTIAGFQVAASFLQGVALATVIIVALTLRLRLLRHEEYKQMHWLDWCGYYALFGFLLILVGGIAGCRVVMSAGALMLLPLYPIAILGLLCKLDDMLTSFMRGWRKR
jgi:hypothetical protein